MSLSRLRSHWAAVGAAVAVTLGAGGIGISHATTDSGEKPIFVPIEPCRLLDTRAGEGVGGRTAPLGPAETYPVSGWGEQGDCTLPEGTTGLALNVTAVGPTELTFLTFYPADAAELPVSSNLNPSPGSPPTPNAVNVDLDDEGEFAIYNLKGTVNVIVDVVGYYDDHNHDDRYVPREELAARLPAAVGWVKADALDFTGVGIVDVGYNSTGDWYQIELDGVTFDSTDGSAVAQVTPHCDEGTYSDPTVTVESTDGDVVVFLRDAGASPTAIQCDFSLTVYALPAPAAG